MSRYLEVYPIEGKTAFVTGASSGIGEACSFMLAERGVNLIIVARRLPELENLKTNLQKNHPQVSVTILQADVTDPEQVEKMSEIGEVDFLINCAGLALGNPKADEIDLKETRQILDTNATAAISLFRIFVPAMRKRNSGHVVNIGSVAAFECYEGGSVYNASKHALLGFTNSARMDLADTDVRVTIINPGIVDTDFWKVRFHGDGEKARAALDGLEAMSPYDIADQVVYAITRPKRCQVSEIRSYCNHQAHAKYVFKRH